MGTTIEKVSALKLYNCADIWKLHLGRVTTVQKKVKVCVRAATTPKIFNALIGRIFFLRLQTFPSRFTYVCGPCDIKIKSCFSQIKYAQLVIFTILCHFISKDTSICYFVKLNKYILHVKTTNFFHGNLQQGFLEKVHLRMVPFNVLLKFVWSLYC